MVCLWNENRLLDLRKSTISNAPFCSVKWRHVAQLVFTFRVGCNARAEPGIMGAAEFATRESQPSVTTCEWIVGRKFAAAKPNQIVRL
jgi:hypothetical protein